MPRREIIAALALLALAAAYGVMTAGLPARTLPDTPDPSFFPWINTALLAALGAVLLARGLARRAAGRNEAVPAGSWGTGAALVGVLVVYVAALPALGFVLATVPLFAVLMAVFGERRPLVVAAGAIGVPAALYVLFRHGFGIFLPRGPLAGLLG